MFDKIDVNGSNAHPLYVYLKKKQKGFMINAIKWNFSKASVFSIDIMGLSINASLLFSFWLIAMATQ
jgi:glutathione peroxidase-family protein